MCGGVAEKVDEKTPLSLDAQQVTGGLPICSDLRVDASPAVTVQQDMVIML